MNIIIYSKSNCPNCVTAKRLLDSKGIGYTEADVQSHQHEMAFALLITETPSARQLPQIFINNQRVGGLAGLQAALKELGL
jgi:glutaredoxin 3